MPADAPPDKPDDLLTRMEALADAKRLRLLFLLHERELSVVDLCDVLQQPQSTVSRHLKVLLDAGFVHASRRGTTHYYRSSESELAPQALALWDAARQQMRGWASVAQDALRLDRRLRQRQLDAESFFAESAGQWDRLRAELYGVQMNIPAVASLLPRGSVIADLGCGTGALSSELVDAGATVIGVDSSAQMLAAARKRLGRRDNVRLHRADLSNLPIDTASCDAAMLVLTLTYVPEIPPVLSEAARVLRPGGRLVAIDLLPHDRDDFRREMGQRASGLAPQAIEQWMRDTGLLDAHTRPLPPAPEAKGPALFIATAVKA